jgi:hypothetical protein
MKKEFVMRGKTASGETEVLNFSGNKLGYAYRMTEFTLSPATGIFATNYEIAGTVTAGKIGISPTDIDFNDEGLIASAQTVNAEAPHYPLSRLSVVNDTFLITQNLILMVLEAGSAQVNWQCRFESVKMSGPEEATANYKQFTISDE